MHLAKPHLDIGLYTNRRDAQLAFWGQTAGLPFDQMVKLGGGVQQHRFLALGSPLATIIKVNHARNAIANAQPTGIAALTIARPDLTAPRALTDPDGNRVILVPAGHAGIDGVAIDLDVNDLAVSAAFYTRLLGMTPAGNGAFRLGGTLIRVSPAKSPIDPSAMPGPGYRYLTVQVFDCDTEHAAALSNGATEGRAPHNYGSTARVSFIRDPDGTWIEISQRASVTGKGLPA
jgi:catechol 2,3-dioxygenase-like lactoylglutathione lyase family enzyme